MESRPIDSIIIGERHRKDLGDLAGLAKSIKEVGLLHPVVITSENKLVAGRRRLAAIKELGWDEAPVHVVSGLDDAVRLLRAERDENDCRKEFTPSEAVAIAKGLEDLERAEAKKRQQATSAGKGQKVGAAQGGGNLPPPSGSKGKTRDKVAAAVGMSGRTYDKAKAVVEAAKQDPGCADVKEEMDRTGKVEPAFQEVRRRQERKPQKTDKERRAEPGEVPEGGYQVRGVGSLRAREAIDILVRIPKNDALRKHGFQLVMDWIQRQEMTTISDTSDEAAGPSLVSPTEEPSIAPKGQRPKKPAWHGYLKRIASQLYWRGRQIDGLVHTTVRQRKPEPLLTLADDLARDISNIVENLKRLAAQQAEYNAAQDQEAG